MKIDIFSVRCAFNARRFYYVSKDFKFYLDSLASTQQLLINSFTFLRNGFVQLMLSSLMSLFSNGSFFFRHKFSGLAPNAYFNRQTRSVFSWSWNWNFNFVASIGKPINIDLKLSHFYEFRRLIVRMQLSHKNWCIISFCLVRFDFFFSCRFAKSMLLRLNSPNLHFNVMHKILVIQSACEIKVKN